MGLKDHTDLNKDFKWPSFKMKSVQSINPCKSVIQTIYDIIKAHRGEIKVETTEGQGAEFIIQLPVKEVF